MPYELRRLGYLAASGQSRGNEATALRAKIAAMIRDGRIAPMQEYLPVRQRGRSEGKS